MTLLNLIVRVTGENNISEAMAVPKKRLSKKKGKTRLSNWKNKGKTVTIKAYNAAKTFLASQKKRLAGSKNEEKVVSSSESISDETND